MPALSASAGYAGGAVAYAMLLGAIGFLLAGGGHGVMAFLWIALTGLVFWPVAGAAIAWSHRPVGKAVFVAAMSLHYLLTAAIVAGSREGEYLKHVWAVAAWLVITYVATYMAGQAALWWGFVSRGRHTRAACDMTNPS